MSRRVLIAICAAVIITVFLGLRACFQAAFPVERPAQSAGPDSSVVALTDGSVMIAKPGTIGRDVIDWFNDRAVGPKQFNIGRQPFVPNSDRPAPEARVRLARFATELRANPDVDATIVVCGSGKSAADARLAAARALRLQQDLAAMQVAVSRISARTCRQSVPAAPISASEQDGRSISILLSRED